MKKLTLTSILALGLMISAFSQKPTMELTFTAENNGQYVPLDSILIENLTQGGDTTFYAPDTVLVLDYVTSIGKNGTIGENSFSISQNYPNPFKGKTTIDLYLPEKEYIKITVWDILGRELAQYKNTLNRGNNSFAFYPGNDKYYLLSVTGKQTSKTIKMLNANSTTTYVGKCKIVYNGNEDNGIGFKSQKDIDNFGFSLGDELLLVGYSDLGESGMLSSPSTNQTYTFQFATNIPCSGTPTVTYEGQVYNTIQIFNQCWLKENLNVGEMIPGTQEMEDNGIIEKYCYNNDPLKCDTYGGLYQWDEMMQYSFTPGAKGICPTGWHLPRDIEWKILEGTVDGQYGVGNQEWNGTSFRGYNAGLNLKSTSGWYTTGNGTNLYGFTALPGGFRFPNTSFSDLTYKATYWTTMDWGFDACLRDLSNSNIQIARYIAFSKNYGFSVRCIKD